MGIALGIFRVIATSIQAATKAVLLDLDSGGNDKERWPEGIHNQPSFGAVGVLFRSLRPTKVKGQARHLETYGIDDGGGVIPVAYRDLRLNALFSALKEGEIAHVGYGGAFISNCPKLDAAGNVTGNELVIYVPYEFDGNGVPTKAHTIEILGTAAEKSLSVIHAEGMAITMKAGGKNSVVVKNKAGDAYIEVNDDGHVLNGNTVINGGATIGDPVGAMPAAIATKLAAYITQLEIDIASALTAVGAGPAAAGAAGATAFTAGGVARTALVAQIPALKTSIS